MAFTNVMREAKENAWLELELTASVDGSPLASGQDVSHLVGLIFRGEFEVIRKFVE
jgi:hypothetical protein